MGMIIYPKLPTHILQDWITRTIDNRTIFSQKKVFAVKDEIIYTPQDASTFVIGVNIDRQSYKYTSKTTDEEKSSTKKALLNKDFRQSISFAFDREAYAAQANGKDGIQT